MGFLLRSSWALWSFSGRGGVAEGGSESGIPGQYLQVPMHDAGGEVGVQDLVVAPCAAAHEPMQGFLDGF